jgi:hypothetical protein
VTTISLDEAAVAKAPSPAKIPLTTRTAPARVAGASRPEAAPENRAGAPLTLRVGDPVPLRISLRNDGDREATFDDQTLASTLQVIGPDDRPLPYIGLMYSTAGTDRTLAPGTTIVLREKLDVARDFIFDRPGRYIVRMTAEAGGVPRAADFRFELTPGELAQRDRVFLAIRKVIPEDWSVRRSEWETFLTPPGRRSKFDPKEVRIWFADPGEPARPATGNLDAAIHLLDGSSGRCWLQATKGLLADQPGLADRLRDAIRPALEPAGNSAPTKAKAAVPKEPGSTGGSGRLGGGGISGAA